MRRGVTFVEVCIISVIVLILGFLVTWFIAKATATPTYVDQGTVLDKRYVPEKTSISYSYDSDKRQVAHTNTSLEEFHVVVRTTSGKVIDAEVPSTIYAQLRIDDVCGVYELDSFLGVVGHELEILR